MTTEEDKVELVKRIQLEVDKFYFDTRIHRNGWKEEELKRKIEEIIMRKLK